MFCILHNFLLFLQSSSCFALTCFNDVTVEMTLNGNYPEMKDSVGGESSYQLVKISLLRTFFKKISFESLRWHQLSSADIPRLSAKKSSKVYKIVTKWSWRLKFFSFQSLNLFSLFEKSQSYFFAQYCIIVPNRVFFLC